jgi:hypothetical protein
VASVDLLAGARPSRLSDYMTDDALTLDDLPSNLIATGPQRRETIACHLFAAGYSFAAIDAAVVLHATIDQAMAELIRDELPALRGLTPEAACGHLIDASLRYATR